MYISVQEELTKSDIVITQDVTGKCGMEEHLEKTSLSNNECSSIEETHPGILSSNNNVRKKPLISSKKISTECPSTAENTFGSSSSSVSNIISSGTPSQPTSRRQTFITLEKFDGSENRPFSPSSLNNMSSAVTVKNSQEGMAKIDIPPKAKRREVALSKSDSEKIVHGNKRSGLRSSKAEQTGTKSSKLLMTSDQKKNTQESIDSMAALENNPAGLLNQTECVLDNQAHLSESAVEHEDTMLKPTTGNALLENSTAEEKTLGTNLESKENTPPGIISADQMVNEDSHVQIAPNQKTLRRSLRRRPEIAEPITDSQDKENNLHKKERHKDEEKTLQKSPLHVKDDTLPKQKLISEQTIQENLIEKDTLHEKTLGETSTNAEIEKNRRKPDLESKSEGDASQDIADKSSEKQVRGRTRYQTRRASQGLLSSIENSESDNSEAKEESSRKKRSGKWKNKNSDSIDIEDQEEKMEQQECLQVEIQAHDHKGNSEEVDINIKSQSCENKDENNTVTLQDSTVSSDLALVCDISNTYEEKSKTNKCADNSFLNSSVSELNLRTRNANKRLYKRDSIENNSVEEGSKIGISDISLPSEKTFQTPECRHKRSRRVRRSKGCDCCGEKSQPQEKSPLGLTNTENYNVKVSETKKIDVPTPVTISETSTANIYPEAKLPDECHSVNFHLDLKEENDTIDSLIAPESELKERDIQDSLPSEIVNFKEEVCDTDFKEAMSIESQEPSNKKCKPVGSCLDDTKDISLECSNLETKEEKPEAILKMEVSTENMVNLEADTCKVKAEFNVEVEAMELDVECDKSEANFSEQKSAKTDIFEEEATEKNSTRSDESEADATKVLIAEEAVTEEFSSAIGHPDNTTPIEVRAQLEVPEQTAVVGGLDGNDESDPGSSEEMNAEMENYEERVTGEVNAETDHVSETEDDDLITKASKFIEAETNRLNVEIGNISPNTLKVKTEEGKVNSNQTEASIVLNKPEEVKLDDSQMKVENVNETLQEVPHTSEKVKETLQSLISERDNSELITEDNNTSPQKLSEFDPLLLSATESPSGMQGRCIWSPLASPSSSILKRGLKRPQEDEISPPVHKVGI